MSGTRRSARLALKTENEHAMITRKLFFDKTDKNDSDILNAY